VSPPRRVVAVADDLMVRSRIEAAAGDDTELVFPRDPAEFSAQLDPPPDLIVVAMAGSRLAWPELIRAARENPASRSVPVLAFGPHKDLQLRGLALQAGADRIMANSAFVLALPELLRGEKRDYAGSE
jgi:PleD family two-component response regulator